MLESLEGIYSFYSFIFEVERSQFFFDTACTTGAGESVAKYVSLVFQLIPIRLLPQGDFTSGFLAVVAFMFVSTIITPS